jgi:hypothetical protein
VLCGGVEGRGAGVAVGAGHTAGVHAHALILAVRDSAAATLST